MFRLFHFEHEHELDVIRRSSRVFCVYRREVVAVRRELEVRLQKNFTNVPPVRDGVQPPRSHGELGKFVVTSRRIFIFYKRISTSDFWAVAFRSED